MVVVVGLTGLLSGCGDETKTTTKVETKKDGTGQKTETTTEKKVEKH